MLHAKDIQSGNMLDIDSNLKNIYQQTDALRQTQPVSVYARTTTATYGGYNSSYEQIIFTASTSNISTSGLSFNSSDSTFNVDNDVFTDFFATFTAQYYTANAPANSIIYVKFVGIKENNTEVTINPFYRIPVNTATPDGLILLNFTQLFSITKDIKKIKVMITTNATQRPTINSATLSITGICKNLN